MRVAIYILRVDGDDDDGGREIVALSYLFSSTFTWSSVIAGQAAQHLY